MTGGSLAGSVQDATEAALVVLRNSAPDDPACSEGVAGVLRVRDRPAEVPTVLLVGEPKGGKSALVNALLGAPGLAPVGLDVATSEYLLVRHGRQLRTRASLPGTAEPVPIPTDRLRDWVTGLGSVPADRPAPRLVEVSHPAPVLTNLILIDTPGAGGLRAVSGHVVLAAVRPAAALLFVVDASAPFTTSELDFLRTASGSVDTVLVALTKIDAYRGWRQVLADDRALLARAVPRLASAPFFPVSARLAELAAAAPTAELASMLRTESRVVTLQLALQTMVAAKATALHDANTLRAARTQLTLLGRRLVTERAALDPDPGLAATLRARREELAATRRAGGRSWQVRLRAEIQRARLESMAELQREVREATQHWRGVIDAAGKLALDRLPGELAAVLHAMSRCQFERLLGRLWRVTDNVLREVFGPVELAEVYAGFAHAPALWPAVTGPGTRQQRAEDRVVALGGMMAGFGAGRLVAFLPAMAGMGAAAVVALPVSIGLGLAASAWLIRSRRQLADRQHYRQWLVETLAEARAALESEVAAQFVDAEQTLTLALDEAIGRRVAALEREITQLDDALRLDTAAKDRRRTELTRRIATANTAAQHIDAVLPRVRASSSGLGSVAAIVSIAAAALDDRNRGQVGSSS